MLDVKQNGTTGRAGVPDPELVGESVRVQNRINSMLRSRGLAASGRGFYASNYRYRLVVASEEVASLFRARYPDVTMVVVPWEPCE